MRALVRRLAAEPSQPRGNDGRAWRARRPRDSSPLGAEDAAGAGGGVAPAKAACWQVLAVDETYVLEGGQRRYLYRAVDKLGQTVDFLLTARRDVAAARRFFERAIDLHDVPEKITLDKSGANTAAVRGLMADSGLTIELRQSKYLNNVVEQDHRATKRRTRPMMGFKSFGSAVKIIAGVETMHMLKKGQLRCPGGLAFSAADYFYSLATE